MQKYKMIIGVPILVLLIAGAIFIASILRGCLPHDDMADDPPRTAEYRKISAEDAYKMMSETDKYILLDVRSDEEYQEQHIPNAVLIPDYEISTQAESELQDKDALILIYCRSGRRSVNAAKALVTLGYNNVYDFGGIIDWPYETE